MDGSILGIGTTCGSVSLLFVQDVMLRAGLNSGVLETLDSVVGGFSSEVWVTSSHFPLTTCNGTDMRLADCRGLEEVGLTGFSNSTSPVHTGTQSDVDTLSTELFSNRQRPLVHELTIKRRSRIQTRGESRHAVCHSYTERCILETQSVESDSFDSGDVSDTSTACPSDSGGQIHFLLERQVGNEHSRLFDGVRPATCTSSFG